MVDQVRSNRFSRRRVLKRMGGFFGFVARSVLSACQTAASPESQTGEGTGDQPMQISGTMLVLYRRQYFKEMEDLLTALHHLRPRQDLFLPGRHQQTT